MNDRGGELAGGLLEPALHPGDAEVGELGLAVVGHEDVLGLDVTVERAGPVRHLDRAGELDGDPHRLGPRQSAFVPDAGGQRALGDVAHGDVLGAGRRDPHVEDVDDVRVPRQGPHGPGLPSDPLPIGLVESGA
jgi:hypothetical protein